MLMRVFADTSFFIALLHAKDAHHVKALQCMDFVARPLLTSRWVMVETANYFSREERRPFGMRLFDLFDLPNEVELVAERPEDLTEGIAIFRSRGDKEWSLTDCISMALMQRIGLNDILTADRHFRQAGFNALLIH